MENSLKKLNKNVNRYLKLVVNWVRANKLGKHLNTGKTKTSLFKSRNEKITKHFNFCIDGQKIVPVDSVKYLELTQQGDFDEKNT